MFVRKNIVNFRKNHDLALIFESDVAPRAVCRSSTLPRDGLANGSNTSKAAAYANTFGDEVVLSSARRRVHRVLRSVDER